MTNVNGTASQTTVPGYHTLSITGYEALCVSGGPATTARLLLSPSAVESTPVFQDLDIFGSSRIWKRLDILFRRELLPESAFCWRPH